MAVPELKAVCHIVTKRLAGRGTAREVIELILKAQGRWEEAVASGACLGSGFRMTCDVAICDRPCSE